ncbi:MAG: hypothetical protein KN64_12190 [Sulfurovum sp. AS07-7]|nr:MAG: hypothetical protein KN64_12190 [Sulfurovum sp. AS07-7]
MKLKITVSMFIAANLLFFTGCGVSQPGSNLLPAGKQSGQLERNLPKPPAHARNTDSITEKIESAFAKNKDLDKTYIYADRDNSNILLTGIVANEKQKFIASAIANSFVTSGIVVNRVEIYRPNMVKNPIPQKIVQTKK